MIATNAEKIIRLRKRGYRPDEMILVSLVGKIGEPNHTVFANHRAEYDWRWVVGLDIAIYADSSVDWEKTVIGIIERNPNFLALWDYDRKEGTQIYRLPDVSTIDKHRSLWKWNTHFLPWIPCQNKQFESDECN